MPGFDWICFCTFTCDGFVCLDMRWYAFGLFILFTLVPFGMRWRLFARVGAFWHALVPLGMRWYLWACVGALGNRVFGRHLYPQNGYF